MAQNAPALTRRTAVRIDEVERMRQRVDLLRDEIGRDAYELDSRIRATFDLRRQISRHPLLFAALAVGGILVVARTARSLLRSPDRAGPRLAGCGSKGFYPNDASQRAPLGRRVRPGAVQQKEKR